MLQVKPDWRTSATAVGSIVSVLLVAAGLFYTNQANRKQQEATRQQQQLATQQQVADRFGAAIDQLGQEDERASSKLSIRLGGIYGLQRLMIDSPRDEPAVVQVLCAFVRTHAPLPDTQPLPGLPPRLDGVPVTVPSSPADVRAAVTVLSQRPHRDILLDFSGTLLGLNNAVLAKADLHGVNLIDANLSGADLREAVLIRTNLQVANLSGANLSGANLSGADLRWANLTRANLSGANLKGAELGTTNVDGANLSGANLLDMDLSEGQLDGALIDVRTKLPPGFSSPKPLPRLTPPLKQ